MRMFDWSWSVEHRFGQLKQTQKVVCVIQKNWPA